MPIKIPNDLPAVQTLLDENIFAMTERRAITQDIRPLKILILNLMPTKIDTETQLSRVLGNSPLQVEIELIHTSTYHSKNVSEEHLLAFYKEFSDGVQTSNEWRSVEFGENRLSYRRTKLHLVSGTMAG